MKKLLLIPILLLASCGSLEATITHEKYEAVCEDVRVVHDGWAGTRTYHVMYIEDLGKTISIKEYGGPVAVVGKKYSVFLYTEKKPLILQDDFITRWWGF